MSEELDYYKNLATIMIKTRGARFTAASGLMVRERWSIGTTAFLSVFMLAWSIWLIAKPEAFSPSAVRFFSGLSVVASVAILVLSLLDYAYGRTVKAEKLQQNALKISILLRKLEREICSGAPDPVVMRTLAETYETELAETQVNHAPSDYKKWQIGSLKPTTTVGRIMKAIRSTAYDLWYYVAPLLIHLGLVFLIVLSSIWYFAR